MPRKHCRSLVRTRGRRVLTASRQQTKHFAFSQLDERAWRDWNFRTITVETGWRLVSEGEAVAVRRLEDGKVQLVGFRATKPTRWERPSATTLTEFTLGAVGTHAMHGKLTRSQHREVEKFIAWPLIGDTKATCVRPRLPESDRRYAESVMCRGLERAA